MKTTPATSLLDGDHPAPRLAGLVVRRYLDGWLASAVESAPAVPARVLQGWR